mgnify:CR=1 FL=1
MSKFYLTTPIYYVNDEPHIGHTYTTVIADVLARYYKLVGYETFFLTGTDEHGNKIQEVAKKNNLEPKTYCDNIVEKFKIAWKLLDIGYNNFIRTTDDYHEKTVQYVLQKIYESGDIYKKYYEGLYCIHCEKFISEDELVDGVCPDHKVAPVIHKEENYFFKLSKYKDIIYEKIKSSEIKIYPETRRNEILGKLELEVEDISISRKTLKWGIVLPFDSEQTIYVWIDALINYLSGIDYFGIKGQPLPHLWPCDLHLIGKDILWFHAVIWPGLLLALKLPLPKQILAHGFFTINGQKMSKTLGNVIKPKQLVDLFGIDATRMLLISNFPLGVDGDFSIDDLRKRYNTELADNLGNLITRTFGMLDKYFSSNLEVKKPSLEVYQKINECVKEYENCFSSLQIHKIPQTILELTSYANWYVQYKTPWILFKEAKTEELKQVIFDLLYCIKASAVLFYPVMPNVTLKIFEILNEKFNESVFVDLVKRSEIYIASNKFNKSEILFKKI